jgi:hypothetical protein
MNTMRKRAETPEQSQAVAEVSIVLTGLGNPTYNVIYKSAVQKNQS